MASLKMLLRWGNADATKDINDRLKTIFGKGFIHNDASLLTPIAGQLSIQIEPLELLANDGVIVQDSTTSVVSVLDGEKNYIVIRARYRLTDTPILTVESLVQAAYVADPEQEWLHVIGVVDLTIGGFSQVTSSEISYEEQDRIDSSSRFSWRTPVANAAALPIGVSHHNRDGDVRIVLDTHAVNVWNSTSQQWVTLGDQAVIQHIDDSHSNGIIGGSSSATLEPLVGIGAVMEVIGVPAGSAYYISGNRLTSPTINTSLDPTTVGAAEGLLELSVDNLGTLSAVYRAVFSGAVSITGSFISGISDNHPIGLQNLQYVAAGSLLSWAGGNPVDISAGAGTYRLYTDDYVEYIDYVLVGAAPAVNSASSITISAKTSSETSLLLGQFRWDGSGVLTLEKDLRLFGTLDTKDLSTHHYDTTHRPTMMDLRGNSFYEGGLVTDIHAITPFTVRVTSGVCYLNGQRRTFSGTHAGVTVPISSTTYLYAVEDPNNHLGALLTSSSVDPFSVVGLVYASISMVLADAVTLTAVIDQRDPRLIVGNATRNSYVQLSNTSQIRWDNIGNTLNVESQSGLAKIATIGDVEANRFTSTDRVIFSDSKTLIDVPLSSNVDNDLNRLQPSVPSKSLLGTIEYTQKFNALGVGMLDSGMVVSNSGLNLLHVSSGTCNMPTGERAHMSNKTIDLSIANTALTPTIIDQTYYIAYVQNTVDSLAAFGTQFGYIDATTGLNSSQIPLATFKWDATASIPTEIVDCRRFANGSQSITEISVGILNSGLRGGANFSSISQALTYIGSYSSSDNIGNVITLLDDVSVSNAINLNVAIFSKIKSRLNDLTITGKGNKTITFSSNELFVINDGIEPNLLTPWKISDITFDYANNVHSTTSCVFKNLSPSSQIIGCNFGHSLTAGLGNLFLFDVDSTIGGVGSRMVIDNCDLQGLDFTNTNSFIKYSATHEGYLDITNCSIGNTASVGKLIYIAISSQLYINVSNCQINMTIAKNPDYLYLLGSPLTGSLDFHKCKFIWAEANPNTVTFGLLIGSIEVNIVDCTFLSIQSRCTFKLSGVTSVLGSNLVGDSEIDSVDVLLFDRCDFRNVSTTLGNFKGVFQRIINSDIFVSGTMTPIVNVAVGDNVVDSSNFVTFSNAVMFSVLGTRLIFSKSTIQASAVLNTSTIFSVSGELVLVDSVVNGGQGKITGDIIASSGNVNLSNSQFLDIKGLTSTSTTGNFKMSGCTITSNRNLASDILASDITAHPFIISCLKSSNNLFSMDNCRIIDSTPTFTDNVTDVMGVVLALANTTIITGCTITTSVTFLGAAQFPNNPNYATMLLGVDTTLDRTGPFLSVVSTSYSISISGVHLNNTVPNSPSATIKTNAKTSFLLVNGITRLASGSNLTGTSASVLGVLGI